MLYNQILIKKLLSRGVLMVEWDEGDWEDDEDYEESSFDEESDSEDDSWGDTEDW